MKSQRHKSSFDALPLLVKPNSTTTLKKLIHSEEELVKKL